MKTVSGFSKLSKLEKIDFLADEYLTDYSPSKVREMLKSYWHNNEDEQKVFDEFSENTLSNFYSPYGVVPNTIINGESYCIPMVIEESSVVAACAKASKFWASRGGFKAEVVSTDKVGQVHFIWKGETSKLEKFFNEVKEDLLEDVTHLTMNMEARGGGVTGLELVDCSEKEPHYYQLKASFNTCDAMGANFINSVLEAFGEGLKSKTLTYEGFVGEERDLMVIMAILSNYTPDCLVRAYVECPVEELADKSLGMEPELFAKKFSRAVRISKIDVHRATTHNKGIFNGVDAVILATGNDFRAVEACGHTYAARDGQYRGLTDVTIEDGIFRFSIELPLSVGTVGGLTALHPLAKMSLDMMGRPNANKLMQIVATIGLAQNFAALRSLVTTGIQKGHMKMHLMNILNHLEATEEEREKAKAVFENEVISFSGVREFLSSIRNYQ